MYTGSQRVNICHNNINIIFIRSSWIIYLFLTSIRTLLTFHKASIIIPNLFDVSADLWSHRYRTYSRNIVTILLTWFYRHHWILFSNFSSIGREAFKSRASLAKRDLPIFPKDFFFRIWIWFTGKIWYFYSNRNYIVKKIDYDSIFLLKDIKIFMCFFCLKIFVAFLSHELAQSR